MTDVCVMFVLPSTQRCGAPAEYLMNEWATICVDCARLVEKAVLTGKYEHNGEIVTQETLRDHLLLVRLGVHT